MIEKGLVKKLFLYEILWIVVVVGCFGLHKQTIEKQTQALIRKEAETIFNKDLAFRMWAARHGGVYVPETEDTPANPYLAHIKERDLSTPSSRKLTLMNPAYILKQVMSDYAKLFGTKGHITSLNLLNPDNKPDAWEKKALLLFQNGRSEVSEFADVAGEPSFRFMRPLVTKESCLKCHGGQGYSVGDIRGGVAVSMPLGEYKKIESETFLFDAKVYTGFGLVGALLIFFGLDQNVKRKRERQETQDALFLANEQLESKVVERTNKLDQANQRLNEQRLKLEETVEKRSSELLAAQKEINCQEKVNAVSRLAGTVSHDLRNPLGAISNAIYFLKMKGAGGDEKMCKYFDIMEGEIDKAKEILANILDFARTDPLVLKRLEIKALIQRLISMWEFPENISCEFKSPNETVFGLIDLHQLTRVLNNLIDNAIQAMPDGGNLTISLTSQEKEIEIRIKDTGSGISADKLEMVFEPLFTTRGKGFGMGLSSAKDIVELHGGTINVESEVGKGTEFIVSLSVTV